MVTEAVWIGLKLTLRVAQAANRILPWGWQLTNPGVLPSAPFASDESSSWKSEFARNQLADRLYAMTDRSRRKLSKRGLFIVGHARSGTTILQNALNDSDDIFLLGEPNLHYDAGGRDFRRRYNAMHRGFGNQENKSSYCPALFEDDESWDAYLIALNRRYRYVGAKIVVDPEGADIAAERIYEFAIREFSRSRYVFTFRNPVDVLCSMQNLCTYGGRQPPTAAAIMRSYLVCIRLYIRMLRTMPKVQVLFHGGISAATFADLGKMLKIDLGNCHKYYSDEKANSYTPDLVGWERQAVDRVQAVYEEFRASATNGYDLIQIDQNRDAMLNPSHPTPLGLLCRHVEETIAFLDQEPDEDVIPMKLRATG